MAERHRATHFWALHPVKLHIVGIDTIHGLFSQWDDEYRLVSRPKSDIVCRIIARAFRWPMPLGKFIGWDLKPLPENFTAPERMGLIELVERVTGQVAGEKSRETIAIQA